jgi:hypothetical protein
MFVNENEIRDFVRTFEACTLEPSRFRHAQHLALGAFYVCEYGPAEARNKMRDALLAYTRHLGKEDKYNEALTMDWMERIAVVVAVTTAKTLVGKVNAVIEHYTVAVE